MAVILTDDIFYCIFVNEHDRIPIQSHWNMFAGVQLTISQDACFVQIWWSQLKSVKNYRANKEKSTDKPTDGQTQASTIPLRPEMPRGENETYMLAYMWKNTSLEPFIFFVAMYLFGFHAIDIIWVIRCESAWCHSILNWKQALILFHTWTWCAWSAETWQLDASKILSAWGASHSLSPVGLISGDSLSLRQVKIRWSSKTYHDIISNCTVIFFDESEHEWIHDKGCHWETSLHEHSGCAYTYRFNSW